MTTIDVTADRWHDAVAEAMSTHPWLAHLTAIDGAGERGQDPDIIVVCRCENHDGDDVTVSTRVPRDGGSLDSVVDAVAGAAWYQREIHDSFGVTFVGPGADNRALLIRDAPKPPLRKEVVLAPRRRGPAWPARAFRRQRADAVLYLPVFPTPRPGNVSRTARTFLTSRSSRPCQGDVHDRAPDEMLEPHKPDEGRPHEGGEHEAFRHRPRR